ncbi:MAG: hypothetical protein WKG07_36070 [Hymenobacter sp.]
MPNRRRPPRGPDRRPDRASTSPPPSPAARRPHGGALPVTDGLFRLAELHPRTRSRGSPRCPRSSCRSVRSSTTARTYRSVSTVRRRRRSFGAEAARHTGALLAPTFCGRPTACPAPAPCVRLGALVEDLLAAVLDGLAQMRAAGGRDRERPLRPSRTAARSGVPRCAPWRRAVAHGEAGRRLRGASRSVPKATMRASGRHRSWQPRGPIWSGSMPFPRTRRSQA